MDLFEVDLQKKISLLIENYISTFEKLFSKKPMVSENDKLAIRNLLRQVELPKEEISDLVMGYLTLGDEWIRDQGYPLSFLEKRYNAIVSRNPRKLNKQKYVVAITESGRPVYDADPNRMGPGYWFKPITEEEWPTSQYGKIWEAKNEEEKVPKPFVLNTDNVVPF